MNWVPFAEGMARPVGGEGDDFVLVDVVALVFVVLVVRAVVDADPINRLRLAVRGITAIYQPFSASKSIR